MLELKNISKIYNVAGKDFTALDKINIKFRKNEFVSILGQSGSGKTTLLNIIGGLDQYTDGDLIINGKSTKEFKDRDWDSYRNHSIGFVFQSYNLIPHQTILNNVELALTLSGVDKKTRREKAIETLNKVGLSEHIYKKPTQLSGGQMQRVAIARALINDPDILLADEPTGALDSETSVVIMELLKEVAKDRLVIMVTHNPELAVEYSTRIVNLKDGHIIDDSDEYNEDDIETIDTTKNSKTSMSFFTALGLSFNNLLTKKARTILTAFAGSIGIIGIALIISISSGANNYIDKVQEDTLSLYPITIESESIDLSALGQFPELKSDEEKDDTKIQSTGMLETMLKSINSFSGVTKNNISNFKDYIEDNKDEIEQYSNAIDYGYNIQLNIFKDIDGEIKKLNPFEYIKTEGFAANSPINNLSSWDELLSNKELLESQYELVSGEWPNSKEDIVLFVNKDNKISDLTLYQLGLKNPDEIEGFQEKVSNDEDLNLESTSYNFDDIIGQEYTFIPSTSFYEKVNNNWIRIYNEDEEITNDSEAYPKLEELFNDGLKLKIVGIVRPSSDTSFDNENLKIGYTHDLTEYIIDTVNSSEIGKAQLENEEVDVFTNKPFLKPGEVVEPAKLEELPENIQAYVSTLPSDEQQDILIQYAMQSTSTFEENLVTLGIVDNNIPSSIMIYPKDFESKEKIDDFINTYNDGVDDDIDKITYTDLVGIMISSVTSIIDIISYILIAFVSISLVVSSIMIGIITYVSVLERTKEIGILKSIGASKKDISRVFNAETVIVGLVAGVLGIVITLLAIIPVNSIVAKLTGVSNFAQLPIEAGIVLIVLSVFLTLVAGLIPARIAAKKDAVEALRTE